MIISVISCPKKAKAVQSWYRNYILKCVSVIFFLVESVFNMKYQKYAAFIFSPVKAQVMFSFMLSVFLSHFKALYVSSLIYYLFKCVYTVSVPLFYNCSITNCVFVFYNICIVLERNAYVLMHPNGIERMAPPFVWCGLFKDITAICTCRLLYWLY